MTRKLKSVGIAMVAILAMSAVVVAAAQAATFTSTKAGAISSEQTTKHEIKTKAGTIKCSSVTFSGVAALSSSTQTLTPTYSGCLLGGVLEVTVTMNGCDYLMNASGTIQIACPAGKSIQFDLKEVNCTIHLYSQVLGSASYSNFGGHRTVTYNTSIAHYELTGTLAGCGVPPGTYTDGTFKGASTEKSLVGGSLSFDP